MGLWPPSSVRSIKMMRTSVNLMTLGRGKWTACRLLDLANTFSIILCQWPTLVVRPMRLRTLDSFLQHGSGDVLSQVAAFEVGAVLVTTIALLMGSLRECPVSGSLCL